jgi:hypothetical protein
MGNGRHDTGLTHSAIKPDDSTESPRFGLPSERQGVW